MPFTKAQKEWNIIPLLLALILLVCTVGGMFCPMPSSAADVHSAHQPFNHSSSFPQDNCPDLLKESAEIGIEVGSSLVANTPFNVLDPFLQTSFRKVYLTSEPLCTSYPLLFLLFSVLLN
jgi:hypothetical protein